MWRITIEVLEELGNTGIDVSGNDLTYLEIYGPEGRMGFFSGSWPTAEAMRSDLMQNHGGGIPMNVIDQLVNASEVVD
ncbi:MAG: hypothetical protein EBU96_11820 [Actinobacteria bacterium]|nr:hypothetical protein [Actinomycetota bacterium]